MTSQRLVIACVTSLASLMLAASAAGAWNGNGSGSGFSKARSLSTVAAPTAAVSGRNVTVSWSAPTGGAPANGYVVRRYNTSNAVQTIGAACSGTIPTTSCVESAVPPGTWKYTVTATRGNWRAAESAYSSTVTVSAPALTLTQTTITRLPTTLSGQATGFSTGQTVTFRLDNPTSGTLLSGSITPNPVPTNGTSNVSVTIPAGTPNGAHTVYAIGSGGDQASRAITVVDTPKVTASVIAKTAGGDPSFIRQGGAYYVYANATGTGNPPAGIASLRANVSNLTTGQTAVTLTSGSYSVGGISYNYRSASLTATNPQAAGPKSYSLNLTDAGGVSETSNFSVTVDNSTPSAAAIETTNVSGGTPGTAELGDTMTMTYSEEIDANSVLAGWNGSTTNVVVRLNNATSDTVQIYNSTNATLLRLGTVDLASGEYTTTNRTFGQTGTPSTITRTGAGITVTLGTANGAVTTATTASSMIWTPVNTATDRAGNAASTTALTEAPPVDLNF